MRPRAWRYVRCTYVQNACVLYAQKSTRWLFFCAGYEDEEMAALNWAVSHIGRKLRKRRYFLRLFLSLQHTDKEKEKVKSLRNQIERKVLCSHDICHPAPIEKKRAETSSSDAVIIIIVGGKNRTIDFLPQRQHSSLFPPAFMRNSAKSVLEQKKEASSVHLLIPFRTSHHFVFLSTQPLRLTVCPLQMPKAHGLLERWSRAPSLSLQWHQQVTISHT